MINKKIFLNICFLELSEEFRKDSKTSSNHPNKRAIGVRVIEVLMYIDKCSSDVVNCNSVFLM